jgi:hypothetical protein
MKCVAFSKNYTCFSLLLSIKTCKMKFFYSIKVVSNILSKCCVALQVVALKPLDRNGLQGNREFLVEVFDFESFASP